MYFEYFDKTPVIRLWLAKQVLVQHTALPASHPAFIISLNTINPDMLGEAGTSASTCMKTYIFYIFKFLLKKYLISTFRNSNYFLGNRFLPLKKLFSDGTIESRMHSFLHMMTS